MNYIPGGLDEIVAAAGPDDLEIVKIDGQASEEVQSEVLKDADVLFFVGGGRMPEVVLRQAARLRFIQLMSAGYDYLDIDLLKELGISFASSGDMNSPAVAEHTMALILAVARKIAQADAAVRAGEWLLQEPSTDPYTYGELFGKRVGIVGLGNIGRNVAQRLQGFDCDVLYSSPRPISEERRRELGVKHVGIEELFEASDIVTLHVPLTSATKHMVNRDRLERMKPSAILINTTRGAVVDESALIEALQERKDCWGGSRRLRDGATLEGQPVVPVGQCRRDAACRRRGAAVPRSGSSRFAGRTSEMHSKAGNHAML